MPRKAGAVCSIPFDNDVFAVPDHDADEIEYHIGLIHDARFTEPYGNQGMMSLTFSGFTWEGHDFLDSVRDPG